MSYKYCSFSWLFVIFINTCIINIYIDSNFLHNNGEFQIGFQEQNVLDYRENIITSTRLNVDLNKSVTVIQYRRWRLIFVLNFEFNRGYIIGVYVLFADVTWYWSVKYSGEYKNPSLGINHCSLKQLCDTSKRKKKQFRVF